MGFNIPWGRAERLADRKGRPLAVMVVDLLENTAVDTDPDTAGPLRLLPAIALQIKGTIRESDTLARIGEMVFGIILHTLQEPEDASRVAEKIYREIDRFFLVSGHTRLLPVRIGVSLFPRDGSDCLGLIEAAAAACGWVKIGDEIPVRFYKPAAGLGK